MLATTRESEFDTTTTTNVNVNMEHRIPLAAIIEATNNFDDNLVVGTGGFGNVYMGVLADGKKVAIKRRLAPHDPNGQIAFETEIEMLSQLRHRHLVSLIGYCDENNENIIIYEYMENGSLQSHLYGNRHPPLSWKQRLEICIGAGVGLEHLHAGSPTLIIHRDVKSSNILLDQNFNAKLSDFGLSKARTNLLQDHVTTTVKGSIGYIDPEYFRTQRITNKSDVYSFGVVLYEVLCARDVINPSLKDDEVNLLQWALQWQEKGDLEKIIDPSLQGRINQESLRLYGEIAKKCIAEKGIERPSIHDILSNLELALRLQEQQNTDDVRVINDDITEKATTSTHLET